MKKPAADREWLLQFAVVCMCLKEPDLIEQLEISNFSQEFKEVVDCLVRYSKTGVLSNSLEFFMERNAGVVRQPGEKFVDAVFGQLLKDAEWRKRRKEDGFMARLDQLQLAIKERRDARKKAAARKQADTNGQDDIQAHAAGAGGGVRPAGGRTEGRGDPQHAVVVPTAGNGQGDNRVKRSRPVAVQD